MQEYLEDFDVVVIPRNTALEEAELQFLQHDVVGCVVCNLDLECLVFGRVEAVRLDRKFLEKSNKHIVVSG